MNRSTPGLLVRHQLGWVMVETSDRMWSTGEGNGKPLQYSCLENPMNSMISISSMLMVRVWVTLWRSQHCRYLRGPIKKLCVRYYSSWDCGHVKNHEKGNPGTARAFNSRFGLKINEAFFNIREIFPSSLQLRNCASLSIN